MGACCGGAKAAKDGKQGGKIESKPVMKKPTGGPMKSESEKVESVPMLSKEELNKQKKKAMQSTKPKGKPKILEQDVLDKMGQAIRNKAEKANLEDEEDRFLTNFGRK